MLEDSISLEKKEVGVKKVVKFERYLSSFGLNLQPNPFVHLLQHLKDPEIIFLGGGLPNPDHFPITELQFKVHQPQPCLNTILRTPQPDSKSQVNLDQSQQYTDGMGNLTLLQWIKDHVIEIHRPKYSHFQVMLTVGNTDGLYKTINLTMDVDQVILVERWCYPTAMETFKAFHLQIVPVDMDDQGILPESMVEVVELWNTQFMHNKVRALYTVPTGQNPTGATWSLERRKQIYQLCQLYHLFIIEDDPYYYLQIPTSLPPQLVETSSDSEFIEHLGFHNLIPSLLSLDVDGRVIRLDSFAKTLAPGLRIGYVTANRTFCTRYKWLNEISTQFPSGYSQAILSKLLIDSWNSNQLELLIAKLRYKMGKRVDSLTKVFEEVNKHSELFKFNRPVAGMFFWLKPILPTQEQDQDQDQDQDQGGHPLLQRFVEEKVLVVPATFFDPQAYAKLSVKKFLYTPFFRLSFMFEEVHLIEQGIHSLVKVLNCKGA